MKKRILLLTFSIVARDPRVLRQIGALKNQYELTVMGCGEYSEDGVRFLPIARSAQLHIRQLDSSATPGLNKNNVSPDQIEARKKSAETGFSAIFKKVISVKLWSFARLVRKFLSRYRYHLSVVISGTYEDVYWKQYFPKDAVTKASDQKYDLILSNHINTLPCAIKISKNSPVLYDAYEYYPGQYSGLDSFFYNRYYSYICKTYFPSVTRMSATSESHGKRYAKEFSIQKPFIVWNAPHFSLLEPSPVTSGKIRMIHHGAAHPRRRIEDMISVVLKLEGRFHCDFALVSASMESDRYIERLKKMALGSKRIRFIEPVSALDIPKAFNQYDIGFCLIPPTTFNMKFCLPGKLFEFVQSRLAVVTGPLPEIAKIVKDYNLGVVSKDFSIDAIASEINALTTEQIREYKQRSHQHAKALSWEESGDRFLKEVTNIIDRT